MRRILLASMATCQLLLLLLLLHVASGLTVDGGGTSYGAKSAAVRAGGAAADVAAGSSVSSFGDINHQAVVNKFLPDGISRADKLQAFLECRKECIAKCDRLVYVYSTKKEFCHDCIRQCMIAVLQQARSLGIEFNAQEERMQGDSPDSASSAAERQRLRRKWKKKNQRNKRQRRQRKQQQQKLLKNCIVH